MIMMKIHKFVNIYGWNRPFLYRNDKKNPPENH